MVEVERHLRADAERNRRRLLEAAMAAFREHGLDVGMADIARRAGVGQGTVFRHFPSKDQLIAAIVVQGMHDAAARGREQLSDPDPREALFAFLDEIVERRQLDRALVQALGDELLAKPEIRAAMAEVLAALDALIRRAQQEGAVRGDIGALDVMMMLKGACEASGAFGGLDPAIAGRQLDLIRAALCAPSGGQALRGRAATVEDLERIFSAAPSGT